MKKEKVIVHLMAAALFFLCAGAVQAAVVDVKMVGFAFEPREAVINVGDTVRWTNTASIEHTTTSGTGCTGDGVWDSGLLFKNDTFSFVFTTAGQYPYFCIPHCLLGMTGMVTVSSSGVTTTTSAPGSTTTTTTAPPTIIGSLLSLPSDLALFFHEWPQANNDYCNTRAVFNSRINSKNVTRLKKAWAWDIPGVSTFGAAATNPIIMRNVIYFQDLKSNVYALNLISGKLLWEKDYNADNIGPNGVAVARGRVFATKGSDVVALDRKGAELWTTTLTTMPTEGTDIQLCAYGGLVYASTVPGASVTNFYNGGAVGRIFALDQQTGAIVWQFDTVDTADVWGNATVNSGGGAWYPPAIDMMTGTMYWGIGNPGPFPGTDVYPNGTSRPGPNLYTDSIVALDAGTGALQWSTQVTQHDLFDHDFQLSPILTLATINGTKKHIAIGGGKGGTVYAFDRANGDILWQTAVGDHHNDDLTELPAGTTRVFPGIFGGIETPMALAGNSLFVPYLNVFTDFTPSSIDQTTLDIAGGTGGLAAIDVNTGAIIWDRKFDHPNFGGATVVNDLVFTATFDGTIFALDRNTGDALWTYTATGPINAWPAVVGNMIILPVGQGSPPQLIAFKLGL